MNNGGGSREAESQKAQVRSLRQSSFPASPWTAGGAAEKWTKKSHKTEVFISSSHPVSPRIARGQPRSETKRRRKKGGGENKTINLVRNMESHKNKERKITPPLEGGGGGESESPQGDACSPVPPEKVVLGGAPRSLNGKKPNSIRPLRLQKVEAAESPSRPQGGNGSSVPPRKE